MRKILFTVLICLTASLAFAQSKQANPNPDVDAGGGSQPEPAIHWCGTMEAWEASSHFDPRQRDLLSSAACPSMGVCDAPATRDAASTASKTIRVLSHVIRRGDGTGGVSQATVDATIAQMNADFAANGSGISFVSQGTRFHNNEALSSIASYCSGAYTTDINSMKDLYNESPATQCNIYFSGQDNCALGILLGIGTFPWDANALAARGGLWVNNLYAGTGQKTATHEIGHNLGLWHTHHGVSEVTSCGTCYEYASGFEGSVRGDFAEDTPPTPTNYNCSGPGGSDCQGTAWGATQPQNYMGYAPDACYSLFTTKQELRMHCWSADRLSGWFVPTGPVPPTANFSGTPTSGPFPLNVTFTDLSTGAPTSWAWDFGDGGTSTSQNPSHSYTTAGSFTVTLTATNAQGSDAEVKTNYVTVTDPSAAECDDFNDNNITNWVNSSGTWTASSGFVTGNSNTQNSRRTSPFGSGAAVSITCDVQMNTGRSQRNARLLLGWVSTSQYRYLEADDLNNQLRIVERTGGSNTTRAQVSYTFASATTYSLKFEQKADGWTIGRVGTDSVVAFKFASAQSGPVGIGYSRANSRFDNFCVSGATSPLIAEGEVRNDEGTDWTSSVVPVSMELDQNYPNPFNPKTNIRFTLPNASAVSLEVRNVLGQLVTTVYAGELPAGSHQFEWDSNSSGRPVASGVYFYTLRTNSEVITKKMMLLK